MGTYYSWKTVEAKGRRIEHYPLSDYPKRPVYHRLVAVCDRAIFKQAADVTDPKEYKLFYDQYRQGFILSFDLFDYNPTREVTDVT